MTGLDKILEHIEQDANTAAKEVMDQARKKADEIMASAKAEGGKKCADIRAKSEADVTACLSRAKSAAVLQEKKAILKAKQNIINGMIDKAKEELLNLPADKYFDNILKMVKKYSLPQDGQIIFSKKDFARLPDGFEISLRKELSDKAGASLVISKETNSEESTKIDGGFVLVYGEIEENCTFDALFSAAKDILQDKVCAVLFE